MGLATALIDGNNFYASCEQSLDPSLIGKPVVVLSNNDGCIVARSAEARALGIAMGTPYFKARQELERQNVVVRSSNYALYADMSQRMMSLLEIHCEELEIYSSPKPSGASVVRSMVTCSPGAGPCGPGSDRSWACRSPSAWGPAKARQNWPIAWPSKSPPMPASSIWATARIPTPGSRPSQSRTSGASAANWRAGAGCGG